MCFVSVVSCKLYVSSCTCPHRSRNGRITFLRIKSCYSHFGICFSIKSRRSFHTFKICGCLCEPCRIGELKLSIFLRSLFSLDVQIFVLSKCLPLQVLVFLADHSFEAHIPVGGLYALTSAWFYAMYLVFLRRKVDNEDKMDIPMFFGKT